MISLYELFLKVARVPVSIFCRLYCPIKLEGLKNIPKTGGVILAGNHRSNADGVLVQLVCLKPISFFLYEYYYYFPVAHWFFRFVRCIPVYEDRDNMGGLQEGVQALLRGQVVGIFPEAGRTRTAEIRRFRLGVAFLARESQCSVVPIYLGGTDKCLPFGAYLPRRARMIIRFGKSLTIEPSESLINFCTRLRNSVMELGE